MLRRIKQFFNLPIILLIPLLWACEKEGVPEVGPDQSMLEEVNKIRREGCRCGSTLMPPVQELSWNDTLEEAALFHAKDMVERNYFSHISPEGSSPILRAKAAGYRGKYVGENIARGYTNVQEVVKGWLNSENHCKTLMDSSYEEMGAAHYQSYWVQEFGNYQ